MTTRGRPRQFSVEQVVDAALDLVEEHGAEALSMHALARRLGTGTATLYNYVGSRDELLDLMLGRTLTEQPRLPASTDPQEWAEELVAYLVASFRGGLARPAVLQLWQQRPDLHLGAVAQVQAELAMLEAVGFSATRAAEVHRMLSSQALGHLGHAVAFAGRTDAPARTRLGAAQRHVARLGEERIYELAVRALVSSLVAELEVTA